MSAIKTYTTDKIDAKLNSKANANHKHSISDVNNLQGTLDGKSNNGHGHSIGNVTGLQDALNGKASASHNHDNNYLGKHLHYNYFSHANLGEFVNYEDFCQRFGFTSATGSYGFSYGRNQLSSDLMSQYGATIAFQDYDGFAYIDISRQALPYVGFACSDGNFHHYRIPIWNDLNWNNIANKPSAFTPSSHNHTIADINFLQSKLDEKQNKIDMVGITSLINQHTDDIKNLNNKVNLKQDKLTSGSNIKTINGQSIVGSGNVTISASVPTADQNTAGIYKVMAYSPVNTSNWYADDIVLTGKALQWLVSQGALDKSGSGGLQSITDGDYLGAYSAGTTNTKLVTLLGGTKGSFCMVWGRETRDHGHISVQRKTSFYEDYDCVAFASGDHGYWGKSDLTLTVFIPPNTSYYLFGLNVEKVYVRYATIN